MKVRIYDHLYILATIAFTAYGQMILKWRIGKYGAFPEGGAERANFFLKLLTDPFIASGIAAGFFASLAWMATMTKFDMSYAYPFTSINLVLVTMGGIWLFAEPMSAQKLFGVALIVAGTLVVSRGL